jgi:hypothetical protein
MIYELMLQLPNLKKKFNSEMHIKSQVVCVRDPDVI